jgi:ABC-type polysaccharide/polyol phosphate export permease
VQELSRAEEPPPNIRYRRALHLKTSLKELWDARSVVYSLSERDLRSRYSQMALGVLWNILGPLLLMFVIVVVLNRTSLKAPHDVPKPIFIYLALLPWGFFQGAVSSGGTSLVANNSLLNKVYAPREVFPLSQVVEQIVDTTCSSFAFIGLLVVFHFMPKATSYWLPIPLITALIFTLAITILISGLTVFFRDLRQAIPVFLQLGLFLNPIAYDLSRVSTKYQPWFVAINPLASVINDMRRCVLYGQAPKWPLTLIALAVSCVELAVVFVIFKQMEAGFADVA